MHWKTVWNTTEFLPNSKKKTENEVMFANKNEVMFAKNHEFSTSPSYYKTFKFLKS